MSRVRVKICGVRDGQMAQVAARAGADAVGLVFVAGTPRAVDSVDQARQIVAGLPPFCTPVGLFVDAPASLVRQTAAAAGISTIQLHGREGPGYAAELAPLRVIKAVAYHGPETAGQLSQWHHAPANVVGILIDAPPPATPNGAQAVTVQTGGHGKTFDWQSLSELKQQGLLDRLPPLILAGGLTPSNVAEAIRTVQPYAVDVSSGVEAQKGVKDERLIEQFIEAANQSAQGD